MKVRYTRRAQRDLERILAYLDERSPRGSSSVKHAIRRAVETIALFPSGGRKSSYRGVRERPVGHYPYIVYWAIADEEALILHIRHASRQRPEN